jgi:hypothetical protein
MAFSVQVAVALAFGLTWPSIHVIGLAMNRQPMAFRLSKQQLAERGVLVADLREKDATLNAAIAVFNQAIEPLSRPVAEALRPWRRNHRVGS